MRLPLLSLLLLPLSAFAQYRPSYTPPPPRMGPTPLQVQQQSQQLAHQNFQRQQAAQQQMMMQQMMRNQQQIIQRNQQQMQQQMRLMQLLNLQQRAQYQEKQRLAEQKAAEEQARLAQEQQRRQQAQTGLSEEQALARQQADARQRTRLTVKNYREVFLPGQINVALQAMVLAPEGRQQVERISQSLRGDAWWRGQEPAQARQQLAAYADELAALTTGLLGFSPATTPAAVAPLSVSRLNEQLAKEEFDQAAAGQLVQEAALAERIAAGGPLAQAVVDLQRLAATPDAGGGPQKLHSEARAGMRRFNKELQRYHARVGSAGKLLEAQKAILKSTADYLARTETGQSTGE